MSASSFKTAKPHNSDKKGHIIQSKNLKTQANPLAQHENLAE